MMSNRKYDSSKIRVEPVFSYIQEKNGWRKLLLWLANKFPRRFSSAFADYSKPDVYYSGNGGGELPIAPNEDLLDFLVFNDKGIKALRADMKDKLCKKDDSELSASDKARIELFAKETREKQRKRARVGGRFLREFLFEGIDYPDVVIITNRIVLIIEGKLTESHLTTRTTWLDGRDQMIRHLDSAMACKQFAGKKVFGMYIVADSRDESVKRSGRCPKYDFDAYKDIDYWKNALPQYADNDEKINEIKNGYLGHVTWHDIGNVFGGIDVPTDIFKSGFITLR